MIHISGLSGPSAYHALDHRTVAEIQKKIAKQSGRHQISRILHARIDKDVIAAWKSDLNRILNVQREFSMLLLWSSLTAPLQTELAMNTHTIVADVHQNVLKIREDVGSQNPLVSNRRAFWHHLINTYHHLDSKQVSILDY